VKIVEKEAITHIIAQISQALSTDKAGTPRKLTITSPQSASLPSSQLIPEIIIKDVEPGLNLAYAQGPNTQGAVEEILQWIEDRSGIRLSYTVAEPPTHLLISLPEVHLTQGQPKEIEIRKVTPQEARILVIRQLDKTNIDSLKEAMGVEGEPVLHTEVTTKPVAEQRAELAQRFTFEDVSKIPPGVDPKQLDFLRDAAIAGVFDRVAPDTAKMIEEYFTSEATQPDIAKNFGITTQAVQKRIMRGIDKLHRVNPELANKYPLEQIKKGKDETVIFKSERSKERRSDASIRSKEKRSDAHINRRKRLLQADIFTTKPSE
jgi:predicted DNA-binding protein YlxM (UPF0122 family)